LIAIRESEKKTKKCELEPSLTHDEWNWTCVPTCLSLLFRLEIYAEVEIPVASNWRPVVDKTLVASNLESITVIRDVDVF